MNTTPGQATSQQTIGVLGVGRVGTAVARQLMRSGFTVNIAGSGPASDIELIIEFTAPGAVTMTADEVADRSDIVILATPLHKYRTLSPEKLAGKVVVDAMNYWIAANGTMDEFEDTEHGTSETVQSFLPNTRLVKSLNHIGYHDLEDHPRPHGAADRRGLAVASDDVAARHQVMQLIDAIGFDPVDAGTLDAGRSFEPDTVIFNGVHTADELRQLLDNDLATQLAS